MSITLPPKGTHFSDGVRVGPILGSRFAAGANVLQPSTQVASPIDSHSPGIYVTPTALLDIIPAAVNTANLFALATIAGNGYVPLITTNSIFQTFVNNFSPNSFPAGGPAQNAGAIMLDVPRNIIYTGLVNSTAVNFTVWGWDQYEQPMVETVLTTAGANTTTLNKAFKWISAMYVDAGTTADVSIGVGNKFGLPYYLENANDIFAQKFNGALDAGTITVGDPLPATGTTGDVRGTYTPAANADSVKRLTINAYSTSGDTRNYYNSANGTVYLANNPLATGNATFTITVTAPGHQFTTGENVTISGGTGTINGVLPATYNITAPVTVVDANSFTYPIAIVSGGAPASGGGTTVQMSPGKGNLYQTTFGRFGVNQYVVRFT